MKEAKGKLSADDKKFIDKNMVCKTKEGEGCGKKIVLVKDGRAMRAIHEDEVTPELKPTVVRMTVNKIPNSRKLRRALALAHTKAQSEGYNVVEGAAEPEQTEASPVPGQSASANA